MKLLGNVEAWDRIVLGVGPDQCYDDTELWMARLGAVGTTMRL